jgi:proteasome lid subunit RPN8/RPN11
MITIDSTPYNQITAHAVSIFPDECCGFLFGNEESGNNRRILQIREVNNSKEGDKRRRFEITPKDYMQAEQFAITNSISLLGIYHSHPGHPAIPSEHDRIAAQPYFSYIIISVLQGNTDHIRSWRLNDASRFEEEIISPVLKKQSI